jgi:cell division septation protein DedD
MPFDRLICSMGAVRVKQEEMAGYQSQPPPGPGLQRADLRQKVWAAAARMPARPRRLLLRRELEGLSYAQIGAALGISTEKVRRRLHRARALFRKKYTPYLMAREKRVKCRRLGDLVSGYYDGELRGMVSRRVADHLAQCPDCRRAEERLASTSELLATLAPTPAPPGLADKLFTSKVKMGALPAAGGGGAMWRLGLMLLAGGGFVAGVIYLAAIAWDDGGGSSGSVVGTPSTPTPTATPRVIATRAPTVFAVLTPAAEPNRPETVTATVGPSHSATPVPSLTQEPSPEATATPPPPPSATPEPPTATPSLTPTKEPTPPPTPEPSPGGIRGVVSCQQQAASGAQVSATGPYPAGGSSWVGTTDSDGGFSTGLLLTAGTYVVNVSWPSGTFDSAIAEVPDGGYAYVAVVCSGVIGAW